MDDGLTWLAALAGAALGLLVGSRLRRSPPAGRRRAETGPAPSAAEARLEALLGHVTQAVVVVDGRDRLVRANPGARELLRLGGAETGDPFVPLARSAELVDFLRLARADGAVASREIELNRAPAANLWIRVAGAPLGAAGGDAGAVVLILDDITRLRRLESLEREFVANVSHDLRTPVTILRGYAETLAQDHAALPAEDRARFIAKVASATARLSSLLEGMLALASLESGAAVRREAGALATAAAEIGETLADRARAVGVALEVAITDRSGSADPTMARRLVQNLVENALAHAQGASRVRIGVDGNQLAVEDDGPGVSPADLARLFDRFYRADRSRRQGGAGIGLSIVRQIAELHGGAVTAELVRPHGLRVQVSLGADANETPAI